MKKSVEPLTADLTPSSLPEGQVRRLAHQHGSRPRRGAGRPSARGVRAGRQQLLRGPRCRLDGHGAVLRPGSEAPGPAVGVDEGHLPAPHHRRPRHGPQAACAHLRPRSAPPPLRGPDAGGDPGRHPACGVRARRQQLLRGPRCRLDGHGAVLRPGQEAPRPAVGVDEGHLPAPHHRRPRHGPRAGFADVRSGARSAPQPGTAATGSAPEAEQRTARTGADDRGKLAHVCALRGTAAPGLRRLLLPRRVSSRRKASTGSPAPPTPWASTCAPSSSAASASSSCARSPSWRSGC